MPRGIIPSEPARRWSSATRCPRPRSGVVVADLSWFRRDVLVGPPGGRVARSADPPTDRELAHRAGRNSPPGPGPRGRASSGSTRPRHYPDQDEVEVARVAIALPELGGFGSIGRGVPRQRPAPVERAREQAIERAPRGGGWPRRTRRADRHAERNSLPEAARAGVRRRPTATPTPSRPATAVPAERVAWSKPTIVARGPLVGALEVRTALRGGGVRARLDRWPSTPAVRCSGARSSSTTRLGDHRLRVRIPTGVPGDVVVAGGPFGAIRRARRSFDACPISA